ncbi:MAG: serine/threonine-protein kinase PknK, partial [Myxococcales bacterium]|nr:serine/threonine-protein kinase PknK [Myxococcales bacterium]
MLKLTGFEPLEQLYVGPRAIVWRMRRLADGQRVVVKMLADDYPSIAHLQKFEREHDIGASLDAECAIQVLGLEHVGNKPLLLLEDIGGVSLWEVIPRDEGLPMGRFLRWATALAGALARVHAAQVIHKDITPRNVIVNVDSGELRLTDFGIATRFDSEQAHAGAPGALEGTLAYMSPEQTGRMNRSIDQRSDLYSTGATLFAMLTGAAPFVSRDPLEMVYSHLARPARSPRTLRADVPEVICDIVLKLLSKDPDTRYQSARALHDDLQRLLARHEAAEPLERFALAASETRAAFSIPQRLYGREAESAQLLRSFQRVAEGTIELALVAGHPGVGKTALVEQLHRPITAKRGLFAAGKFDQLRRDVPYASVMAAFGRLVRQLLTEPQVSLEGWRSQLVEALGSNARVIADVIPELAAIIGDVPPASPLAPAEALNRFLRTFRRFVGVFATHEHPLVLFLDDMQWADPGSLELLRDMLVGLERGYLLVIAVYRDNEVGPDDPLRHTIDALRDADVTIESIALRGLEVEHVAELCADTLRSELDAVRPLAELSRAKTDGNPFFLREFLHSLHHEGLIRFDEQRWRWDLDAVKRAAITDNVVELTAARIRELGADGQRALGFAACVGNRFDVRLLSLVLGIDDRAVIERLRPAVQANLLVAESRDPTTADTRRGHTGSRVLRFVHDRVQQAAYSLIDEAQRARMHLEIGRVMRDSSPPELFEQRLFEIVNQLDVGRALIDDESERVTLAQLNQRAGSKAMASSANATARDYLQIGIELLPDDAWQRCPELSLTLHRERAECEYLVGDQARAAALFESLDERLATPLARAELYARRTALAEGAGNYVDVLSLGRRGLGLLGVDYPEDPAALAEIVEAERARFRDNVEGRDIAAIVDAAPVGDEQVIVVLQLLTNMTAPAYFVSPAHCELFVTRAANLALEHGNAPTAPANYSWMGVVLSTGWHEYDLAYALGQLSLRLAEKAGQREYNSKLYVLWGLFIAHWKDPLRSTVPLMQKAYSFGQETGDLAYGGYGVCILGRKELASGMPLADVARTVRGSYPFLVRAKNVSLIEHQNQLGRVIKNLRGETDGPLSLSDDEWDEHEGVRVMREVQFGVGIALNPFYHLMIAALSGEHAAAHQAALDADEVLLYIGGMVHVAEHAFYHALALAALLEDEPTRADAAELRALLDQRREQLAVWERHCAANNQHKRELVDAAIAVLDGDGRRATDLYRQAIEGAEAQGFTHEAALANEWAARYFLARGLERGAAGYLKQAHFLMRRWGATRLASRLAARYPAILTVEDGAAQVADQRTNTSTSGGASSSSGSVARIDLETFKIASQTLAREIELP